MLSGNLEILSCNVSICHRFVFLSPPSLQALALLSAPFLAALASPLTPCPATRLRLAPPTATAATLSASPDSQRTNQKESSAAAASSSTSYETSANAAGDAAAGAPTDGAVDIGTLNSTSTTATPATSATAPPSTRPSPPHSIASLPLAAASPNLASMWQRVIGSTSEWVPRPVTGQIGLQVGPPAPLFTLPETQTHAESSQSLWGGDLSSSDSSLSAQDWQQQGQRRGETGMGVLLSPGGPWGRLVREWRWARVQYLWDVLLERHPIVCVPCSSYSTMPASLFASVFEYSHKTPAILEKYAGVPSHRVRPLILLLFPFFLLPPSGRVPRSVCSLFLCHAIPCSCHVMPHPRHGLCHGLCASPLPPMPHGRYIMVLMTMCTTLVFLGGFLFHHAPRLILHTPLSHTPCPTTVIESTPLTCHHHHFITASIALTAPIALTTLTAALTTLTALTAALTALTAALSALTAALTALTAALIALTNRKRTACASMAPALIDCIHRIDRMAFTAWSALTAAFTALTAAFTALTAAFTALTAFTVH
ncbi:unnamed protein product [Closterium sp. NIES-54]